MPTAAAIRAVAIACIGAAVLAGASDPGHDDLVLFLPFDEGIGTVAGDASGAGNNGSLVGAGWVGDGRFAGAVALDGSNDYVDVVDADELNTGTIAARTISAWFRVANPAAATKQVVVETGGSVRGLNIYLQAGRLYVGGWNQPAGESGWAGTWLSTAAPTDGAWHHVALVLDGSASVQAGALTAYLDGVAFGAGPGSQLWPHSGDIGIGAMDNDSVYHDGVGTGSGNWLRGGIDHMRWYNRPLVADEIAWLASEVPDPPPPPPPPGVDPKLVHAVVEDVGTAWEVVSLPQSYAAPVVIATAAYGPGDLPAVPRVRAVTGTGFQVRVQNPVADAPLSGYRVHYLVVESGIYTVAEHGVAMEAYTVQNPITAAARNWGNIQAQTYHQSYAAPVVLGQVMSTNDPGWSTFAAFGPGQGDPPTASSLRIAKHVGEDPDSTRSSETLGVVVIDAGKYQVGDVVVAAGLGSDIVQGVGNNPPYSYGIDGPLSPATALLSPAGFDGGDGGWPVLWGSAPLGPGTLRLALDEDQGGDSERSHTTEQVAWLVLGNDDPPYTDEPKLRHGIVTGVGDAWQRVDLPFSYVDPVVVATPVQVPGGAPVVTRVRNAGGDGFDLRVQDPAGVPRSGVTVHYVVVESGVFAASEHGFTGEAVRYTNTRTAHDDDWNQLDLRNYQQPYADPVVLGQVLSANDARWSTFVADGGSTGSPPGSTVLRVGKHVAEDPVTTRVAEEIGYLVIEAGSGSVTATGDAWYAGLGADSVLGTGDAPPYRYDVPGVLGVDRAVLSSAGMDGTNGGWPVLWEPSAVAAGGIDLAIDEDTLGDSERNHTDEQVAYLVLRGPQPPVADDQSLTTGRDQPIAVTLTGTDPEGDPLTFDVSDQPMHGSLDGSPPNLTYTPDPGFVGSDSFSFTADDGGLTSAPATITIEVRSDDVGLGDLVLRYGFDHDVGVVLQDQSPEDNDGTLFDDAELLGPEGNRTARFDGEDDRIGVGLPASLDLTGDLTMSAWVLPDALDDNDWRYRNVIARGYYLEPDRSAGIEIYLRIHAGAAQVGHWYGDYQEDQITTPVATDRLVHLVGVHDTAHANGDGTFGAWLLYVDGSLRGTTPSTQAPASIGGEWAIGGRIPTGLPVSHVDRSFRGQIDEPRIYATALTATEVAMLYAAGASDFAPMVDVGPDLDLAASTFPLTASVVDDGRTPVTFDWSVTPAAGVGITGASTLTPEVTVPGPGVYTFTLTATDGAHIADDSVTVTVGVGGTPATLVAHYDFEGSGTAVEDRVGGHHGLPSGSFARQPTSRGQVGLFDGGAAVAIGDPVGLDIAGDITITAWVLRDGAGFVDGRISGQLVSRRYPTGAPPAERGELALQVWGNHLQADAVLAPDAARVRGHKGGALPRWRHVAASYGAGVWRLYVDGTEVDDLSSPLGAPGTAGAWNLGAREVDGILRDFFVGALDDVRIYRGALDRAGILRLAGTHPGNMAPVVSALPVDPIVIDEPADLGGHVFDDSASVAAWSLVSGPGGVVFDDANDPATAATFDAAGDYRLLLEVVDDADAGITGSVEVDVTVQVAPPG